MTTINLHVDKSLEENAGIYYDRAKKMKKKREGAVEALEKTKKQLARISKAVVKEKEEKKAELEKKEVKKEWFEKFRWFISSSGFLCVGGRDATTNEIVVRKHTLKEDKVFHTDIAGSPFFVVQAEDKEIDSVTVKEVADATVTFSKAWGLGLSSTPVFWVTPSQVSKTAQAGEYLTKGAFMIYGKTNYIDNMVSMAIGIYDGKIMGGPLSAVKKHCAKVVEIGQGREKSSKVAKFVQKKIGGTLDDIIRVMPSGGCRVKK